MRLDDIIDKSIYQVKHAQLTEEVNKYKVVKDELKKANIGQATINKRIEELELILNKQNKVIEEFDRKIFDDIVEEVFLGTEDKDNENVYNPYIIIFELKSKVSYANEIIFKEGKTGGKKSYANYAIDTCLFGRL